MLGMDSKYRTVDAEIIISNAIGPHLPRHRYGKQTHQPFNCMMRGRSSSITSCDHSMMPLTKSKDC